LEVILKKFHYVLVISNMFSRFELFTLIILGLIKIIIMITKIQLYYINV
jgi:hypothetical protein